LALSLFGYPDRVRLYDDALGGPEALGSARLFYDGLKLEGEILVAKSITIPEGLAVEFDKGILLYHCYANTPIVFRPNSDSMQEETLGSRWPKPQINQFQLQIQDFVNACRTQSPPRNTCDHGLANVRLMMDLYANRESIDENWYEDKNVSNKCSSK